jgi:2-(1,2-epoxy-1,2-dihydrophenyl)acetyl-CoA isomerase
MSDSSILLTIADGCYRLVRNRPERLNAFTSAMHREVAEVVGQVENDPRARVLVISGAGRAFCAGQDLGERDVTAHSLDLG